MHRYNHQDQSLSLEAPRGQNW